MAEPNVGEEQIPQSLTGHTKSFTPVKWKANGEADRELTCSVSCFRSSSLLGGRDKSQFKVRQAKIW
jgi:hypothetical protein